MKKDIYVFGLPLNILLEMKSDKYEFRTSKPPAPYDLDYIFIDYGTWMKNGKISSSKFLIWPNNPYQRIFGDRVISSSMLCGCQNDIIKSTLLKAYKPGDALFDEFVNKNSNHCGKSLEKNEFAENYGTVNSKITFKNETRFFCIQDEYKLEILDGEEIDLPIMSCLINVMEKIKFLTTLDFFALDCLWDGRNIWLSDLNTFPGTSDPVISKKIAEYLVRQLDTDITP